MITDEDIKRIIQAEREIFTTKDDFEELKQLFSNLQSSVDAYAKKADAYFQEMVVLSHKVNRIEKWVQQIADKVGIKLDY